jgi:hypothetical protein
MDKLPKRPVKKGRRLYGAVYTLPSGERIYLAYRRLGEIFRAGKKSISEAVREGVAAWAIDEETLRERRLEGIKVVGVLCKESDDMWLAPIEKFFDPTYAKIMNYESRGGALQRYLPLKEFRRKTATSRHM